MNHACNCPNSHLPLEWSEPSLTWIHRHSRLDRRCLNPPQEKRAVHIKEGYVVDPKAGDPEEWVRAFPDLYRLEYRLMVPWTEFKPEPREPFGTSAAGMTEYNRPRAK